MLTDPAIAEVGDYDCTAVTIRTKQGRLCQINTTRRAAYGYDQRFEVLGSKGLLQCGNHTPSEVVQWDANGLRADKPEAFFLQRYAAAYKAEMTPENKSPSVTVVVGVHVSAHRTRMNAAWKVLAALT